MASVSVIQVANAMRHTPLPPLLPETDTATSSEDLQSLTNGSSIQGGFVGGGQLAWRAVGPTVEIIQTSTGLRRAAFRFGKILHKCGARVTSVCGVGRGSVSQVVVGVDLGPDASPQGLVALLSLHTSTLTRAFHFAQKVTSVCMVSGGEVAVDKGTLVAELQTWKGILVVGTGHGTLHILDLALDLEGNKVLSDEVSPGSLTRVVTPDSCADQTRLTIIRQGSHPTMCLSGSDGTMGSGHFQLMGPDGIVLFEAPSHLAAVTSLAFFPQLASLAVGYGFGSFQIINLSTLTNDCTSPYEANVPPVLSFACQEPENDPKNYVYLWLCRSCDPAESRREDKGESPALCTMYAMSYDKKVWIEGHGLWYQGLASISPRFEFDALGGLGLRGQPVNPSMVFCGTSVRHATHFAAVAASVAAAVGSVSALSTPDEDGGLVPEQSLCMFGWVGGILEQGHITINHYLAVFDINQWYQAQMPASLKVTEQQLCPYMSFHQLNRVPGDGSGVGQGEMVLAASPKQGSWARLLHTSNDTDWYPAALTYDVHLLTSEGLLEYECPSAQKAALSFLTQQGPSSVVSPADAYARCVFAGLLPSDPISSTPTAPSAVVSKREALLNVALDQHQMYFLLQCVAEFAEGHFTSLGCSLPALLDWACGRVCTIKTANDTLCLPLFDPECGAVGTEDIKTLHRNVARLTSITKIITTIRDYAHTNLITLQGAGELDSRVQVVCLLRQHLEAVLWFYHCGLLAPSPSDDLPEEQSVGVSFPADLLAHIYHNRRLEIQRLSSALKGNEILMIDGLLEEAGKGGCYIGSVVGQAWKEEGGSSLYPPPSLHALLSIFLLPDVTTTTKHRIVQYLFLDLASLLTDGYVRVVEELVKYPSSFSVSPSLIKLTQGFWLLDHKDFQEALNVLLDPLVNPQDLTPWQHRRIMKAFFFQGEAGLALRYATFRKPPKEDQDDIRLHLTLLLANGLVREAYHYQQTYRGTNIAHDLLNHFFHGCEELGKMDSVIRLPLSPMEQEALVSYLNDSNSPKAPDYLFVYYLLRDKYEQAARLQDKITREGLGVDKKRQAARSALVHAYLTYLPHVASKLSSATEMKTNPVSITYSKPQPLSAAIRQAATSEKTRASSIAKTFETPKQQSQLNPFTPFRSVSKRRRTQAIESPDAGIIFTPKYKARDASRVVFPTQLESSQSSILGKEEEGGKIESSGLLFSPTLSKRKWPSEVSLLSTETRTLVNSVIRRCLQGPTDTSASTSQIVSADMLSLLQTPKIKNKKKPRATPAAESSLTDTPQSILKVRQMVQRPHSPSAASDVSVPVFPKFLAKKPSVAIPDDLLASKQSDTSMTPKQLRFHLPKNQGDDQAMRSEQMKKVGEVQMADKMAYKTNDHTEQEETEDWEERQDAERTDDTEREAKHVSVSARPRPSFSTFTTNPLRHPDSGIPTPRLPLHPEVGDSTHTIHPQSLVRNVSLGVADTRDENPMEQESFELHSRDSSTNEMYFSFVEEERKDQGSKVLREEKLSVKFGEENEEESEARDDKMEDIEEENREIRKIENDEVTDDESLETPSAERSKEVEDSEEDSSLDNQDQDMKEEKSSSKAVLQEEMQTVLDSEFECISEVSREPVEDTNTSYKGKPDELVSRNISIFDKSSVVDSPVVSEKYEEVSQQNIKRILTQKNTELSVSEGKQVNTEIRYSLVKKKKEDIDIIEEEATAENEEFTKQELSVIENITQVESHYVTVSDTGILARKPIGGYREVGVRTSLSVMDTKGKLELNDVRTKNNSEMSDEKVKSDKEEEKGATVKGGEEGLLLEKDREEYLLQEKEGEKDVMLEKEEEEGLLTEKEGEKDVLLEKEGEEDLLSEKEGEGDVLLDKEQEEDELLEKQGEEEPLLEEEAEDALFENEGLEDVILEKGREDDVLLEGEEKDASLQKEEVEDVLLEKEQEEDVLQENGEEDVLLKKSDDVPVVRDGEGNVLFETGEDEDVLQEVEGEENVLLEKQEEEDVMSAKEGDDDDNDDLASKHHTLSPREEEMIAEAVREGQGEDSSYLSKFNTSERFSPLCFSDSESDKEEEQEETAECSKTESKVGKEMSDQSEFSTSEHFSPLRFIDSESEKEENQEVNAENNKPEVIVEDEDIAREKMEEGTGSVMHEARRKLDEYTGSSSKETTNQIKEAVTTPDSSFMETEKRIKEAVPPTTDNYAKETAKQVKEAIPPTTPDGSSKKTDKQEKATVASTTPTRKTRKQSISGTPDPTYQDPEARDYSYSTPTRWIQQLSGATPTTPSASRTVLETVQNPEAKDHSSLTPTRLSQQLSGGTSATPSAPRISLETAQVPDVRDHSSSTPTRQSRVLSSATPATLSASGTALETAQDPEAKGHSSSTPVRRSRRLSGATLATPIAQDTDAKDHSSLTPTKRSRRLSGATPSTASTSRTAPEAAQDPEVKDHSSLTPTRRSRRLSGATPATPVASRAAYRKLEAATPGIEADEDSVPAVPVITRSGRKLHQVPLPVTRSRPSTPASVTTTPARRSRRLSKGNDASTPDSVTTTPVRRSRRLAVDNEAVEKVTLKLELSPSRPASNPVVVLRSLSPDIISALPVSPSVASKKEKSFGDSEGKTTPSKLSARKHTRKSIIDDTLEAITEEDGSYSATDTRQKSPGKTTPAKSTNTRSRRSSRRSIGVMETISENSELSLVDPSTARPVTLTTAIPSSSHHRHSKLASGEPVSDSTEMATPPSQKKIRSATEKDASGINSQVKTPQKRGRTMVASEMGLTDEEEVPAPSKRKNVTESKSRTDSITRRTRSHSQSEDEKSATRGTHHSLASEDSQISPGSTSGRSIGSSSMTSLKESENSEEETVTERKSLGLKRQGGSKKVKGKVTEPAVTELSAKRKSLRLTVGSASVTTTLEHVPREPYYSLKSLKLYSDPEASSSSSVATPDLSHRRSKRLKKTIHPLDTSVLVLTPGEDEMVLDGGLDTNEEPLIEESETQESPETPLRLLDVHTGKEEQRRVSRFRQSLGRTSTGRGRRMTFGNTIGCKTVRSLKLYSDSLKDEEGILEPTTSKKSRRSRRSVHKSASTSVLEIEPEEELVVKSDKSDVEKEQQMEHKERENNSDEGSKPSSEEQTEAKEDIMEASVLQFQFAKPKPVISSRKIRALESLTSEAVEFLFSPPLSAGRIVKQETKAKESAPPGSTDSSINSEYDGQPKIKNSASPQQK